MKSLTCLRTGATQLRLCPSSPPSRAPFRRPALTISPTRRSISSQARQELQAKYARFFEYKPVPRLTPDAIISRAHSQDTTSDTTTPLTIHGFIGKPAKGGDASLKLFAMTTVEGYEIQLASTSAEMLQNLRAITPFSPVRVTGTVRAKPTFDSAAGSEQESTCFSGQWSLQLSEIHPLNAFPSNIIISKDVRFPPTARHLQLRFQRDASSRLLFRSELRHALARAAHDRAYTDVETPLLFKATPEGAREFLVPVRGKPGFAYALPQSPQQYKQMLMASGVERYVQFARCFRDEDLRADRQPEFTQMDLERAFADGEQVMQDVEGMVIDAWNDMEKSFGLAVDKDGSWSPVSKTVATRNVQPPPSLEHPFPRMTYTECITQFGTDKPDLRIPHPIFRFPVDALIQEFISKTSSLQNPTMEACAIHLDGETAPAEIRAKVATFMDGLDDSYAQNPHGAPTALVYDSSQPLFGLSSLGHEGVDALMAAPEDTGMSTLKDGDVVLFQARDNSYIDGSTRLGELRPRLWNHLFAHVPTPPYPDLKFLWVTGFPLFTPTPEGGLASTHHPFTAPLTSRDFDLLFTDPAAATAEHYDLVLNGVEVGGGSRRIHVADVQEFVMREILEVPGERMGQFAHLLQALRDGCPPHAGFALGFDRLCAVLSGTASVKDVIAFPKSHKGEDLFVKAPAKVEAEHWKVYNLTPVRGG